MQCELQGVGGDDDPDAPDVLGSDRVDIEDLESLHARFVEAAAERQRSNTGQASAEDAAGNVEENFDAERDVDEEALERFMNRRPQSKSGASSSSSQPPRQLRAVQVNPPVAVELSAAQTTRAFQKWERAVGSSCEAYQHLYDASKILSV